MANAPTRKPKAWLSWSSGKDSAWALHMLRTRGDVDVVGLLTTLNREAARVAMHAVREELLDMQAEAAGLPLMKVFLQHSCSNAAYEDAMRGAIARTKADGIAHMAWGICFRKTCGSIAKPCWRAPASSRFFRSGDSPRGNWPIA